MADNFGLKIGLEGEKEFKKALSDINSSMKVLGSEMTLVSSKFDKQDKSAASLTAKNTVLNKEIQKQKEKIELLKSALANASESFGETDKRTQSWQVQLNKAEAELNGMERELKQNNAALDKRQGLTLFDGVHFFFFWGALLQRWGAFFQSWGAFSPKVGCIFSKSGVQSSPTWGTKLQMGLNSIKNLVLCHVVVSFVSLAAIFFFLFV